MIDINFFSIFSSNLPVLLMLSIISGIKVDKGLSPLAGAHKVETWCKGLEGLAERTAE